MAKIERIIFIDDDAICLFLNVALIEELEIANEIHSLQNASDATKYIQEHYSNNISPKEYPDLIFLDIRMPGMDGFEFLEELDKLENINRSMFKIIILTTSLHSRDKLKAASHRDNVAACFTKPLGKEDIVKLLAAGTLA